VRVRIPLSHLVANQCFGELALWLPARPRRAARRVRRDPGSDRFSTTARSLVCVPNVRERLRVEEHEVGELAGRNLVERVVASRNIAGRLCRFTNFAHREHGLDFDRCTRTRAIKSSSEADDAPEPASRGCQVSLWDGKLQREHWDQSSILRGDATFSTKRRSQ